MCVVPQKQDQVLEWEGEITMEVGAEDPRDPPGRRGSSLDGTIPYGDAFAGYTSENSASSMSEDFDEAVRIVAATIPRRIEVPAAAEVSRESFLDQATPVEVDHVGPRLLLP